MAKKVYIKRDNIYLMQDSKTRSTENKDEIDEDLTEIEYTNAYSNSNNRVPEWSELKNRYFNAVRRDLFSIKFVFNISCLALIFLILPSISVYFMILSPIIGCVYMLISDKTKIIESNFSAIHISFISSVMYLLAISPEKIYYLFHTSFFVSVLSFILYMYYVMGKDLD